MSHRKPPLGLPDLGLEGGGFSMMISPDQNHCEYNHTLSSVSHSVAVSKILTNSPKNSRIFIFSKGPNLVWFLPVNFAKFENPQFFRALRVRVIIFPNKIPKITTAITEVGRAPVKS